MIRKMAGINDLENRNLCLATCGSYEVTLFFSFVVLCMAGAKLFGVLGIETVAGNQMLRIIEL